MIKKLIHYAWLGDDEMPDKVKHCIDSWHLYLPDYEIKRWDMNAVKGIDCPFLKEALSVKKWAFAADYIRLYALFHEGGIYMDTDVELKGSFDPFLNDALFVGKEHFLQLPSAFIDGGLCVYLTSHCFGAEAGHPFLEKCLAYYENKQFIISQNPILPEGLRYDYTLIPYVMAMIARADGYNWWPKAQSIQRLSDGMVVYPTVYFDGDADHKESVAIHHALGSWRDEKSGIVYKEGFKRKVISRISKILHRFGYMVIRLRS